MSPEFSVEVVLPVEDYYRPEEGENGEDAFEEAALADGDAEVSALNDLADWIGHDATVCELLRVEFVEYDSSNLSHACAHWKATFRGPQDIVDFFDVLAAAPDEFTEE